MFEHRAGKIAMRIKQSDACTIFWRNKLSNSVLLPVPVWPMM